jgi:hypothetical protein
MRSGVVRGAASGKNNLSKWEGLANSEKAFQEQRRWRATGENSLFK